ncbi:MAG: PadR family transcriptional regulator [Bacillaceae bacterium]
MDKVTEAELLESLTSELRRGTIVLSVLSQLKTPQYGYSLVLLLQEKGMQVDANTLYPLLRRLEKQGILASTWDTDGTKPRKYYELTSDGKRIYEQLCNMWSDMVSTMKELLE